MRKKLQGLPTIIIIGEPKTLFQPAEDTNATLVGRPGLHDLMIGNVVLSGVLDGPIDVRN